MIISVERLGISSIFEDMRTHSSSQMPTELDAHNALVVYRDTLV